MKIDNSIKASIIPPGGPLKSHLNTTSADTSVPSDDVKLSPLAGEMQTAAARPPVDRVRIQEIKQAIAEGRFSINAGAIADKLIDSAREILKTRPTA